jgi:Sulfatase-modifying factor enzyme 1
MTMDTAFQAQVGAIFLLAVTSLLLIALQLDSLQAYKRRIAVGSIGVFCAGAAAIWYLEEIKSFLWEKAPLTRMARAGHEGAGWDGGGKARRGGGGGDGSGQDGADIVEAQSGDVTSRLAYPAHIRNNRFQECADCPEMVIIPAGHDGRPIDRFALGRFELTVAEFHTFVAQSGYAPSRQCEGIALVDNQPAYRSPGSRNAAGRPVACVSWRDAQAYATWLSGKTGQPYRLPAAREWRHAARGGAAPSISSPAPGITFQRVGLQDTAAGAASLAQLSVATAPSNGYGVFDMAGGVAEWVDQCVATAIIGAQPASRPSPAAGGCSRQALGGAWTDGDSIEHVRTIDPAPASAAIGLRLARDLPKPE